MEKKENLRFILKSNQSMMGRLIDDITEDESLVCGRDDLLHIRWQTGHLVYHAWLILRSLGGVGEISDSWVALFRRGCDPAEEDTAYPSMAELKQKFGELRQDTMTRLDELTDNDLDRALDAKPVFDTGAMNTVLFLCGHEFYHAGQIAVMRRILGRERSFG